MSDTISKGKKIIYHGASVALLLVSLLFSIFRFEAVFLRMLQTLRDLILSFGFYVCKPFERFGWPVIPTTVQDIPPEMTQIMPITPSEFILLLQRLGAYLIDGKIWLAYIAFLIEASWKLALAIQPLCMFLLIAGLIIYRYYDQVEPVDEEGAPEKEATKPLLAWWWLEINVFYPIGRCVKDYVKWLAEKAYGKVLLWIWLYNLNVLTLAGEAIAYLLYVFTSYDFESVFVYAAKVIMDASIPLSFVPWWITGIGVYKVFDGWRREKGFDRLEKGEAENQEFLEENPENFIATGRPRVGKTQTITDMQQSQEVIFRRKSKEKMQTHKMWFPCFPWTRLERTIRRMRDTVPTFNLDYIHIFLKRMQYQFEGRAILNNRMQSFQTLYHYKNRGYVGDDFIFGYDYKTRGLKYDNGLKIVDLWECIELAAQEYYIYTAPTSLKITNYPVRDTISWWDCGHAPQMEVNFFDAPSVDPKRATWSHLAIMDAFRLGKKKDENNPWKDSFECGILGFSELGKELGNQNTNTGKKADSAECNVRNDLFVLNAKMQGQGCTIDYYTYFRIIADEQRAASIMADFRELGSELLIIEREYDRILMPGYLIEESLYLATSRLMKSLDDFFSVRRSSQNLFYYLATRLYSLIFNHHTRIENTFTSHDVIFKIMDHSVQEQVGDAKKFRYHISRKKNAEAYATNFFGSLYEEKRSQSRSGGINQMPRFQGMKPTMDEMAMMGSHFFDSLDVMFERNGGNGTSTAA